MPKIIELTVEIDIQRVSCPGVWLCQDGRVFLTVLALGTSYQTCLLPPVFPLMFKDVFYFRKRFQESCALNNICCLLKDETIYCELVQWCDDCTANECVILAQYLGALNDVLFPPNMCSNDGVDLLMRRSKDFPGILSPKIEIATKVRIDEIWNQPVHVSSALKVSACHCTPHEEAKRQKQVCHSARYHRNKCNKHGRPPSVSRSRSRSRSGSTGSRSCCSLTAKEIDFNSACRCPGPTPPVGHKSCIPRTPRRSTSRRMRQCRDFCVYSVHAQSDAWNDNAYTSYSNDTDFEDDTRRSMDSTEKGYSNHDNDDRYPKAILESHYIEHDKCTITGFKENQSNKNKYVKSQISPCVCEICKRYHDLFHIKTKGDKNV